MKIICQNCHEILADKGNGKITFDEEKIWCIIQEAGDSKGIISLACPKCSCIVQVRMP